MLVATMQQFDSELYIQCVLIRDPGAALTGAPFLATCEPLRDNIINMKSSGDSIRSLSFHVPTRVYAKLHQFLPRLGQYGLRQDLSHLSSRHHQVVCWITPYLGSAFSVTPWRKSLLSIIMALHKATSPPMGLGTSPSTSVALAS